MSAPGAGKVKSGKLFTAFKSGKSFAALLGLWYFYKSLNAANNLPKLFLQLKNKIKLFIKKNLFYSILFSFFFSSNFYYIFDVRVVKYYWSKRI